MQNQPETSPLLLTVERAASKILQRNQGVTVSCSGGPDSTALAHVLWQIWKKKKIAKLQLWHLDYGLRPQENERERQVLQDFATRHGLPLRIDQAPPPPAAGIQLWARQLRQAAWRQVTAAGEVMAVGHHRDDLIETVLWRMIRGTSPAGWIGMQPFFQGIWRPMLELRRADVLTYCAAHDVPYHLDSSNLGGEYRRNRIRHEVLPLLEELAPGAGRHMLALAAEVHQRERQLRPSRRAWARRLYTPGGIGLEILRNRDDAWLRDVIQEAADHVVAPQRLPWSRSFFDACCQWVRHADPRCGELRRRPLPGRRAELQIRLGSLRLVATCAGVRPPAER